jgi:hypothetical protein
MATYSSKKYPSGSVTSAQLADGTVVAVDLADGAVTSAKLNSTVDLSGKTVTYRSIVAGDIASDAITTAKVAANAVTPAKMANSGAELGMRNRIINGAMVIDQRNAGSPVTVNTVGIFSVDRWANVARGTGGGVYSAQQVSDAPTGFSNSLKFTVTTADTSLVPLDYYFSWQKIEGFNTADLSFGTASAKTVTLSFWVKSSITGQFSAFLTNSSEVYSQPSAYTVNAVNTWEFKTITFTGATAGTWVGATNGVGLIVGFGLANGTSLQGTSGVWTASSVYGSTGDVNWMATNGNTWQVTGVQLEVGSTATPFENRSFGTELFLCMRYYQSVCATSADTAGSASGIPMRVTAVNNGGTQPLTGWQYPVAMRASPSIQTYGGGVAGGSFITNDSGGGSATQTSFSGTDIGSKGCRVNLTGRSNSAYQYWIDCGIAGTQLGWTQNAEL